MLGLAPLAGGGGSSGTPLVGPGASALEAWYRWNLQQEFATLLYTADIGAVAVSVTWPTFTAIALRLRVKAGGTGNRSTCVLEWSADGGLTWPNTIGPGLGATVNLTGGVVLNLPTGTYTAGQSWVALHSAFRDNKNSHHFISQDAFPNSKNPTPKITPYGTFLSFDGLLGMMRCITPLAPNVAGGTSKAFYVCAVLYIDNLSPSSGTGTILWFGDGVTLHAHFLGTLAAGPTWRSARQDDTGSTIGRSSATPPATATPYVVEWIYDGSLVTVTVNGTAVISAQGMAPGGNALASLSLATLGKSFNGGAEGNPQAFSLGELSLYNALPISGDRTIIRNRMRAGFGF